MVKAMDLENHKKNEFELKLRYKCHFRMNTIGKGMKTRILPAMC